MPEFLLLDLVATIAMGGTWASFAPPCRVLLRCTASVRRSMNIRRCSIPVPLRPVGLPGGRRHRTQRSALRSTQPLSLSAVCNRRPSTRNPRCSTFLAQAGVSLPARTHCTTARCGCFRRNGQVSVQEPPPKDEHTSRPSTRNLRCSTFFAQAEISLPTHMHCTTARCGCFRRNGQVSDEGLGCEQDLRLERPFRP